MVFAIIIRGIAYVEPLNGTADVGIRRLHDEVVVGGHEAIGMDHDGKAAYCLQIPPVNT